MLDIDSDRLEKIALENCLSYSRLYDLVLAEQTKLLYRNFKHHGPLAFWSDYKVRALDIVERYYQIKRNQR